MDAGNCAVIFLEVVLLNIIFWMLCGGMNVWLGG